MTNEAKKLLPIATLAEILGKTVGETARFIARWCGIPVRLVQGEYCVLASDVAKMDMDIKKRQSYEFTGYVSTLAPFCGEAQLRTMYHLTSGDEGEFEFFIGKLKEYAERVTSMPRTHDQDGLGMNAIAFLHYFTGGCDWYITERDSDTDNEGQIQAFGSANLGYGAELGYISIAELLANGAELDLYFTPKPLSAIEKANPLTSHAR